MSGTTYFLLLLTYFSFNLLRVSNISPLLVDVTCPQRIFNQPSSHILNFETLPHAICSLMYTFL